MLRKALFFGIPLTLNGIGLAFIYQLDRTLIGHYFGVTTLAMYAVVLSMSVTPISVPLSIFSNIGLSYLLSDKSDAHSNSMKYRIYVQAYSTISNLYMLILAFSLDIVTPLLFGTNYKVDISQQILFSLIAFFRLQRGGAPTTLLIASGRTRLLACLNLSAGVGLVCAWIGVLYYPHLLSVLIGLVVGEITAYTLFFTVPERPGERIKSFLIYSFITTPVPLIILGLLIFNHEKTWGSRLLILGGGLAAIAIQLSLSIRKYLLTYRLDRTSSISIEGNK